MKKIKWLSCVIVVISVFVCMNISVFAAGLPSAESGSKDLGRYITFTYNKNLKAYMPNEMTDYFIVKDERNKYYAVYYNKNKSDGGQLQMYQGKIRMEYMTAVKASNLDTILEFVDNPNKEPASGLGSDSIRNRIDAIYKTATYPDGAISVNGLENILYSSSDYVITQEYASGNTPKTATMDGTKWQTVKTNRYEVDDPNNSGASGGGSGSFEEPTTAPAGGGGNNDEEEKANVNTFLEAYNKHISDSLSNSVFYKSISKVIDELKNIFNEDYSRGQAGLDELGVFNFTLTKPYIIKDFGNDTVGEFIQQQTTSNLNYGIENKRVFNFGWFFGSKDSNNNTIRGVKYYSDIVIGGLLWLAFIWYLWHNMPSLISGEIGQLTNMTSAVNDGTRTTETRRVTWSNDSGEVISNTTTRSTTKKVKGDDK